MHGVKCFVVDALPHHTPDGPDSVLLNEGVTHGVVPTMFGSLCFNTRQGLSYWKLSETYSLVVDLRDVVIRTNEGETAMTMGLRRSNRKKLSGSTIVEPRLMNQITKNPDQFYLSVQGKSDRAGAVVQEVGRSFIRESRQK